MRTRLSLIAGVVSLLGFAGPAFAQAVPDAPQPQKKVAAKPQVDPPAPPKDDNAFPEAVSQDAAKAAAAQAPAGQAPAAQTPANNPSADANPFPEDVSRDAAKAAEHENAPAPPMPKLPPGVSSSQSQEPADEPPINDPVRARKDTEVGRYYLKTQDYRGALLRFEDATRSDPTNVEAIFGLAEALRMSGKPADAAREYQLYLDILPNGPKAKEAMKALKTLPNSK